MHIIVNFITTNIKIKYNIIIYCYVILNKREIRCRITKTVWRWQDGEICKSGQCLRVVSCMMKEKFKSYWSQTGTYEAVVPLINMDFDGLRTSVIEMLSGNAAPVDISSFQNDAVNFTNKDDILTYLIHLGYLGYDEDKRTAFIPNEEIRQEFTKAVKRKQWNELIEFQKKSDELLNATLDLEEDAVAELIEQVHMEYASSIWYNDENSLSSVLTIGYLSAMKYYLSL